MRAAVRACFVCLGNICRSPAAEAVLRQLLDEAGLTGVVEVDSAGTARYHLGDRPDPRTLAEAARRGIPIDHRAASSPGRALRVGPDHRHGRPQPAGPAGHGVREDDLDRLRLLRSFDPSIGESGVDADVPDPYYGEDDGFSEMFDLIEPACRGPGRAPPDPGRAPVSERSESMSRCSCPPLRGGRLTGAPRGDARTCPIPGGAPMSVATSGRAGPRRGRRRFAPLRGW